MKRAPLSASRVTILLSLLLIAPSLIAQSGVRILVLGDSLSAAHGLDRGDGWVALLEERLAAEGLDAEVVNASTGGDTTRGGRARLPEALDTHRPDVLVIELGGNDGLRGIPLPETRQNLSAMVRQARDRGVRVLLVGVRLPSNYGRAFTERFQETFREVAETQDVPLVPMLLAGVAEEPSLMQRDGIHPNAEAQARMLDNVWPALRPLVAEARPGGETGG